MERRTVEVARWGNGLDGPVPVHVQARRVKGGLGVTDLWLPYAERAYGIAEAPPGAVHRVALFPHEARGLALALFEISSVAEGGTLWTPTDG